jgi:hypothetical protein
MSDTDAAQKAQQKPVAKTIGQHAITVVGTVVMVLALVWMLLGAGQGFQLDWSGALPKIIVQPEQKHLGRILDVALRDDESDTRALLRARNFHDPQQMPLDAFTAFLDHQPDSQGIMIRSMLRQRGFFRTSDPALIDALAELAPGDHTSLGLRRLLFEMRGPFAPPNTLDGAEGRFITEVLSGRPADDQIVAEVWSGFIAQTLTFLRPNLSAQIITANIPVHRQQGERLIWSAAVCNGSHLANKFVQLWWETPEGGSDNFPVTLFVTETLPINRCRNEALTLTEIARTGRATLGLPDELHAGLTAGAADERRFFFAIFPTGVAPVDPPSLLQQSRVPEPGSDPDAG